MSGPTIAGHLALVSAGLALAALIAWPARRLLARDPARSYQLLLALLFGSIVWWPAQQLVQGSAQSDDVVAAHAEESARPALPDPDGELRDRAPFFVPASLESASAASLAPPAAPVPSASRPRVAEGRSGAIGRLAGLVSGGVDRLQSPWIAAAWIAGALVLLAFGALRLVRTRRLVRRATPVDDPRLVACLRRALEAGTKEERAARTNLARRLRLVASRELRSPAVVAWPRPLLLVPADAEAGEPLEWALRHELVHLERGDSAMALFQSLAVALLWFHPAAWWLSAEIRRLRELSCDALVVARAAPHAATRKSYALALLEYATAMTKSDHAGDTAPHAASHRCALLHWSRSPTQIQRRIEMLTNDSNPLPRWRSSLAGLFAGAALIVPALGQVTASATLLPRQETATTTSAPAVTIVAPVAQDDTAPAPARKRARKASKVKPIAPVAPPGIPAPPELPSLPGLPPLPALPALPNLPPLPCDPACAAPAAVTGSGDSCVTDPVCATSCDDTVSVTTGAPARSRAVQLQRGKKALAEATAQRARQAAQRDAVAAQRELQAADVAKLRAALAQAEAQAEADDAKIEAAMEAAEAAEEEAETAAEEAADEADEAGMVKIATDPLTGSRNQPVARENPRRALRFVREAQGQVRATSVPRAGQGSTPWPPPEAPAGIDGQRSLMEKIEVLERELLELRMELQKLRQDPVARPPESVRLVGATATR